MKATKDFDKWIGIISISVICIVAIIFTVIISDLDLAKGTYGAAEDVGTGGGGSSYVALFQ